MNKVPTLHQSSACQAKMDMLSVALSHRFRYHELRWCHRVDELSYEGVTFVTETWRRYCSSFLDHAHASARLQTQLLAAILTAVK